MRDLLDHFDLRSEDVIAALYGCDVGTAEQHIMAQWMVDVYVKAHLQMDRVLQ
jgi:hypothetical protein